MNSTPNGLIKEFDYLKGYYLKLEIIENKISIIAYNIDSLDGIRYKSEMSLNELEHINVEFGKCKEIENAFEMITEIINFNNYSIEKKKKSICLFLTIYDFVKREKTIELDLTEDNKSGQEFIKILINEIKKLRNLNSIIKELKEENKNINTELQNLKNIINNGNIQKFNKKYNLEIKDDIAQLNLYDKNYNSDIIEDLSKIYIKDLKELYLYNNNIDNISLLKNIKCEQLEILYLGGNKISDISVLKKVNFKDLKKLYLGNNNIKDISPLIEANFQNLEILSIGGNNINKIDALNEVKFIGLKELFLFNNNIIDITPLKNPKFSKLEVLSLSGNQISDITPLGEAEFSNLKKLYLNFNNISDIKALYNKFDKLELLYLYNNKIYKDKYDYIIDDLKSKIKDFQIDI